MRSTSRLGPLCGHRLDQFESHEEAAAAAPRPPPRPGITVPERDPSSESAPPPAERPRPMSSTAVHANGASTAEKPARAIKVQPRKFATLAAYKEVCRARIAARHDAFKHKRPLGPLVGISKDFAAQFGGYFEVGLTVFHAEPGSGKSALCAQILAEAQCPGLYVTFEMNRYQLVDRHLARECGEYIGKFRTGEMSPERWEALFAEAHKRNPNLAKIHLLDATRVRTSLDEIKDAAIAAKGNSPHLLIVIDSAHAMVRGLRAGGKVSAYDATENCITQVQQLAADLEASVVLIAEQNRSERGGRGQSACANASVYEYGSNHVLALMRDQEIKPDRQGEVPITARFAKNRDGQQGVEVGLRFRCKTMSFRGDPDFVSSCCDEDDE